MKTKLLFICALLFAVGQSFGQLILHEAFDYSPVGNSLLTPAVNQNPDTGTTWNNYTNGSPNDMTIETGPPTGWMLDQAFDLNPQGNAVHWQGGGEDGELDFPAVSGDGSVIYLSFLLDVQGWATTTSGHAPDTYRHVSLGINDNGNVGSGIHIGPTEAGGDMKFRIALGESDSQSASDLTWFPTEYTYTDIGTDETATINQFFIVIKFIINNTTIPDPDNPGETKPSGTGYMWINPAVNTTEPTPDVTHVTQNKNRTNFQSVLLQASSNNRNPDSYVDEIRVATTWEAATGQPALSVNDNELAASINMFPNPANDFIQIESKDVQISSVEMYNLLGKKVISETSLVNDRLNISSLSKGVYLLKINADNKSLTRKVVVK